MLWCAPDLKLADFLFGLIWHAPTPPMLSSRQPPPLPPSSKTLDAVVRWEQGMQSTQVCLAPIARHVPEEGTGESRQVPLDAWLGSTTDDMS